MHALKANLTLFSHRILGRLPWVRKLMQYSCVFFLAKGLLWTALVIYPLLKGVRGL